MKNHRFNHQVQLYRVHKQSFHVLEHLRYSKILSVENIREKMYLYELDEALADEIRVRHCIWEKNNIDYANRIARNRQFSKMLFVSSSRKTFSKVSYRLLRSVRVFYKNILIYLSRYLEIN